MVEQMDRVSNVIPFAPHSASESNGQTNGESIILAEAPGDGEYSQLGGSSSPCMHARLCPSIHLGDAMPVQ